MSRGLGPGDLVEVYDGDADDWFDGFIESEDTIGDRDYYVVRLDDGPVQFGRKVDLMAVPVERSDLIEAR